VRIAILNWSNRRIGGTGTYLSAVMPYLQRAGHEVGLWHEVNTPTDYDLIPLPPSSPVWSVTDLGLDQALAGLSSWRPQLLYSHGMLDPDVELRIDGGVLRAEASLVLRGAAAVAGHTATYSGLYPFVRPALVNGAAGAVVAPHGQTFSVMAFTVTNGKITRIDALLDPERLGRLELRVPPW